MYSFKSLYLLAIAIISCTLWSCTKEKASTPVSQQSAVTSDEALQPGENLVETVTPGVYTITRFIDSSADHTTQFNGYTFDFQADNDVIATKSGIQYAGKWKTNIDETKMGLAFKNATSQLEDLNGDNWAITKLTDHSIILKRKGPDKVVFKLQ